MTTNNINSKFHRIVTTSDSEGVATSLTVANVYGTADHATVADSANSVTYANVVGAPATGTVSAINLDGNVANVLHGDGSWSAAGGGSGTGTVTQVSVVSGNGFAGTVATDTTTPSISLTTTVTGLIKGDGTALSAVTTGVDYVEPSGSITGSSGSVVNAITFNTTGGAAAGSSFDGSTAVTIDYSTVGAPSAVGIGASGVWNIAVNGSAASANSVVGANVTGEVANANYATYAGDVINASQANITSVGTLSGLTVGGQTTTTDLSVTGNVLGSLIPVLDGTAIGNVSGYNLGSAAQRWKDLWIANSTIYMGDSAISMSAGTLTVDGNPVIAQSNGGVTNLGDAANLKITGGSNGQVLTTDGTGNLSWTMISSLVNGNAQLVLDNSGSEPFVMFPGSKLAIQMNEIGAINSNAVLMSISNDVILKANAGGSFKEWTFGANGNLKLPGNTFAVNYANGTQVSLGGGGGGGTSQPYLELTNTGFIGNAVVFTKANYGSEVDNIDTNVAITRGDNQGIYNPLVEGGWDSGVSPANTEWNADGWDDLTNVTSRTYTSFYNAVGGNLGNNVLGLKLVMHDTVNDKYYTLIFSQWTAGSGGGGFIYTRHQIDVANAQTGVTFADGTVQTTAYTGVTDKTWINPNSNTWRIVEYSGGTSVQLQHPLATYGTSATDAQVYPDTLVINSNTDSGTANPLNSLESVTYNGTTYVSGGWSQGGGIYTINFTTPFPAYAPGDSVTLNYRDYNTPPTPVVWWDAANSSGGGAQFRGAIIEYHAYSDDCGTVIGTIHVAQDDESTATHTEATSGSNDTAQLVLWNRSGNNTQVLFTRTDGEDDTLFIQWTSKIFYGSEYYC